MIVGSFWSLFVTSEDLVSKSTFQAILMHKYVNRLSVIKFKICFKTWFNVVQKVASESKVVSTGSGSKVFRKWFEWYFGEVVRMVFRGSGLNGISGSSSDGISKSSSESISSENCLKGDCSSEGSSESNSKSGLASRSEDLENSSDGSNLCDKEFILKSCEYSERFLLKGSKYGEKEYKP
ncbi:uncharacterized protein OCT59_003127 [Rhizophagus irregularis]|uniref:uncharacterized protein n=1 Tax=Rhizophagus irregularis TaxID=588596 RepID=UPI003319F4A0|nr:hypothetical protein OCT59_003127 [Rhizophagus irregularis]